MAADTRFGSTRLYLEPGEPLARAEPSATASDRVLFVSFLQRREPMPPLDTPEHCRHWRYFLLLESDFEVALRYVDPDPRNRAVFSLEFAKQLLAICAQFESIARLLCGDSVVPSKLRSLSALYNAIAPTAPGLTAWSTTFLLQNERIAPFKDWGPSTTPAWWRSYNSIKHHPLSHPDAATLENVLNSLAGLGLLTIRYVKHEAGPWTSRLFDLDYG